MIILLCYSTLPATFFQADKFCHPFLSREGLAHSGVLVHKDSWSYPNLLGWSFDLIELLGTDYGGTSAHEQIGRKQIHHTVPKADEEAYQSTVSCF